MKTYSAATAPVSLITRQSIFLILSAGAFFVYGSYFVDGYSGNSGSSASAFSVFIEDDPFAPPHMAGPDTDGGHGPGKSFDRLPDSPSTLLLSGLPVSASYRAEIPVNPFKYDLLFGFCSLRSPPYPA